VHPRTYYVPPICCQYRSVSLRLFPLFPSASIGRMVTIEISIERRRHIGGFSKPERTDVRFVSESCILCSPPSPGRSACQLYRRRYRLARAGFETFVTATAKRAADEKGREASSHLTQRYFHLRARCCLRVQIIQREESFSLQILCNPYSSYDSFVAFDIRFISDNIFVENEQELRESLCF